MGLTSVRKDCEEPPYSWGRSPRLRGRYGGADMRWLSLRATSCAGLCTGVRRKLLLRDTTGSRLGGGYEEGPISGRGTSVRLGIVGP